MPTIPTPFQTIDVMDVRHNLGHIRAQVQRNHRFVVKARGRDAFIIAPISDRQVIEAQATREELDATYQALAGLEGMVTDPITDASQTVDIWVYGDTPQKGHDDR